MSFVFRQSSSFEYVSGIFSSVLFFLSLIYFLVLGALSSFPFSNYLVA